MHELNNNSHGAELLHLKDIQRVVNEAVSDLESKETNKQNKIIHQREQDVLIRIQEVMERRGEVEEIFLNYQAKQLGVSFKELLSLLKEHEIGVVIA